MEAFLLLFTSHPRKHYDPPQMTGIYINGQDRAGGKMFGWFGGGFHFL